jgi:outer membrane protein assembly factor BamB
MSKNKTAIAFALFLMFAMTVSLVALPAANAADVKTYAFLSVSPNPAGVDQQVLVSMWIAPITPTSYEYFQDFTVTIMDPDGTTETKTGLNASPMGGQYFVYTPAKIGNYTFKFTYPGQTFSTGDKYLSVESPTTTLSVQQEPMPSFQETPLPEDYWKRPINAENRNWASISGNWLQYNYNATNRGYGDSVGAFNPYSQAPRSPHIVWTKENGLGGLVGGTSGSTSYYTGQSYDPYVSPPIIMNGRLYYHIHRSEYGDQPTYPGVVCVDLRTGEELWRNMEGHITNGQLFLYDSGDGHGIIPYLWDLTGSTWDVYDANTGERVFSFDNATTCNRYSVLYGDDGTIFYYILNGLNNWLAMWNSTKAFYNNGLFYISSFAEEPVYYYAPWLDTFDWTLGIEWNVTIPERHAIGTTENPDAVVGPVLDGIASDALIAAVSDGSNSIYYRIAYDITTGKELWVNSDPVQGRLKIAGEGVYAVWSFNTGTWTGYDIMTGEKLWESDPFEYPWGSYINYGPTVAYGKLYSGAWDGYMHALNIKTGKEVWKFSSGTTSETIFNTWPFWNGPIIADGVVFAGTGEETPTQPLSRGNRVFAINAETGEEIWNITGLMTLRAIADGYLVAYNDYDNMIYSFGKGPSATTVTAPDTQVTLGETVVIRGTVLDQSPAQAGTACVSEESMSAWMEYLHMQKSYPTNIIGVQVTIDVLDANGNYRNVGNTTSDAAGNFGFAFKPDIPGRYQIVAKFAGSEAYGSSSDTTYMYVAEAPAATPAPTAQPASVADLYFLPVSTGIVVAIVIVLALLILLFRKK